MGHEIMNPDGQSRGAALIRGFGYCLSLQSTWFHMSKVGVRLLTRVRLLNLRYFKYTRSIEFFPHSDFQFSECGISITGKYPFQS